MRLRIFAVSIALTLTASLAAQNLPVNPTTTFLAETSNNTSAASPFLTQANGNAGAGNVSKVDVHSLLYPGARTKIYAHLVLWFGESSHINIGYSSTDVAQVQRQINDMVSRGIDGVVMVWYGPDNAIDGAAQLVMKEAEAHPGFTFAIMIDHGAILWDSCAGCTPQQSLVADLQYLEQTYFPSPAYLRVNGRPVVTNFDIDLNYTIDWNAAKSALATNPAFLFQNTNGFSHSVSDGAYSWVIPTTNDYGLSYLNSFYAAGMAAPAEDALGAAYKGFNDTLASWGQNRIMNQQCGQTWLETFNKINSLYNSTNQLDAMQLVTWNDYEEGTELETGIDNCVSLSASLSGSVLNWQIAGNENTIDHYIVYISADGNNLMPLDDLAPGSSSLDLCSYSLAPGNYSAYVQAVGKSAMRNQMSGQIRYTAQCSAPASAGGSGSSSDPGTAVLAAMPSSLAFQWGHSGTSQVTVNGSILAAISLSCTNLPVGVTCSFSPASIPAGSSSATSNLTIATTSSSAALSQPVRNGMLYAFFFPSFGVAGLLVSGSLLTRRKVWKLLMLFSLVMLIGLFTSCGGGTVTPASQIAAASSTPHSYTITINGSYGSKMASTQVTLALR